MMKILKIGTNFNQKFVYLHEKAIWEIGKHKKQNKISESNLTEEKFDECSFESAKRA